jgi:uncharacterized protein (DUF2141 family)
MVMRARLLAAAAALLAAGAAPAAHAGDLGKDLSGET